MNRRWILKLLCLKFVLLSRIDVKAQRSSESSGEYLQKVMIELQELNVPSGGIADSELNQSVKYKNTIYEDGNKQSNVVQKINTNTRHNVGNYQNQDQGQYTLLLNDKIDLNPAGSEISPQNYQNGLPTITKVRKPETVGFTRAQLAAIYKEALEKGSAVSLASLTNAVASGDRPHITGSHVEFPSKQPYYQYYFFPLKTFMSEFKKDHGYKTIVAPTMDNANAAQTSQTQLSNPLFVAISTFVTMAVIFMMGVLFLPKLPHFELFRARGIHDDFYYMSDIVMNAVNRYNVIESLRERHLNPTRYITTKIKKKRTKRRSTVPVNTKIYSKL